MRDGNLKRHWYKDGVECGVCGKQMAHGFGSFECRYPNQPGRIQYTLCLDCARVLHGYARMMEGQFKQTDSYPPMRKPRTEGWAKPGALVNDKS